MQIRFEQVAYTYGAGTPFATPALHDVTLTIPHRSFTALIGHTGSGKSTVIQHLNALVLPTAGKVMIDDWELTAKTPSAVAKQVRRKVGIVFQFPESQLFEETVLKDVMFGPRNYGLSEDDAKAQAIDALERVGIEASLFDRSPFDLSGGQKRRVAIAGILAMHPEVLVLDEPTAGLDPKGQREMMALFATLYHERSLTVVLVSHQMNDVAEYANHVIVMDDGTCIKEGKPETIFADREWLKAHRLDMPDTLRFQRALEARLGQGFAEPSLTVERLAEQIAAYSGEGHHEG